MKTERTVTTTTTTTISFTDSDVIGLLNASRSPDDQIPSHAKVSYEGTFVDRYTPIEITFTTERIDED